MPTTTPAIARATRRLARSFFAGWETGGVRAAILLAPHAYERDDEEQHVDEGNGQADGDVLVAPTAHELGTRHRRVGRRGGVHDRPTGTRSRTIRAKSRNR